MTEVLRKGSGCLLMIALVAAPFLHGGTTVGAARALSLMLYAAAGLWMAALVGERRLPGVPKIMLACAAGLMLQGWIMTLNARSVFDRDFLALMERPEHRAFLPGSIDRRGSLETMVRLGALLLLLIMVADLARSTRWLRRFSSVMALAGGGLAVFGIWQKISTEPWPVWPVTNPPPTAFGTFWYHGNAAALLNMTWPLSLAAAFWAFRGQRGHVAKASWIAGTGVILWAVAMNVSKGGHLIAASLVATLAIVLFLHLRLVLAHHGWRQLLAFSGLAVLALAILIVGTDTARSAARWLEWFGRSESDSRLATARACLEMLPDAGWFGYGPGTFIAAFQRHVAGLPFSETAIWKFAHNDWLQYFVEWGFLGGGAWLLLWSIPVRRAGCHFWTVLRPAFGLESKRTRRGRERWSQSLEAERIYRCFGASLALAGVLVHALFDFPLQIMSLQIYAITLAGMLVTKDRHGRQRNRKTGSGGRQRLTT